MILKKLLKGEINQQLQQNLIIENVRAFVKDQFIDDASIRLSKGEINEIKQGHLSGKEHRIDGDEQLLLPGLVDIHSDALEKVIEPRPGTIFPIDMSLLEFDKNLPAAGITSMFHCVAFVHEDTRQRGLRNTEAALNIINAIKKNQSILKTRNFIHLRFDILNMVSLASIKDLIEKHQIDLLSIMDHTPGQGQFLDMNKYLEQVKNQTGNNSNDVYENILKRKEQRKKICDSDIYELIDYAVQHHLPIASHDDDSINKVEQMYKLGIRISEFPVKMDVVKYAFETGMQTVVGSPNILLGHSHSGNVSAREAVKNAYVNLICSDYLPHSLLHSIFCLDYYGIISLEEAIPLITENPAKAVNMDDILGTIESGKKADFILVNDRSSWPKVSRTFIDGVEVYRTI